MFEEKSLFGRLFSYQSSETHSPLENYLIEIFAYCLTTDKEFRDAFVCSFLGLNFIEEEFTTKTQVVLSKYARPDIVMNSPNTIVVIECKVESSEGNEQLKKYSQFLNSKDNYTKKHLIYLTKYFDPKEIDEPKIQFHQIRWYEIFSLITENNHQITNELKKYLKENGMEDPKNFSIEDLLAIKTISATLSKMNEVLFFFREEIRRNFGEPTQPSSWSSELIKNRYLLYKNLWFSGTEYTLSVGFWWSEDKMPNPQFGLIISIPKKEIWTAQILDIFEKELDFEKSLWERKEKTKVKLCYLLPMSSILDLKSNDHFSKIKEEINKGLNDIYSIKAKYPHVY